MSIVNIELIARLVKEQNPAPVRENGPNLTGATTAPDQAEHTHANGVVRNNMVKDDARFFSGAGMRPISIFPNFVKVGPAFHLRNIS